MTGLNLHALVRTAITAVYPDEHVTLYRSVGQDHAQGRLLPLYAPPVALRAQVQSAGAGALGHRDGTGHSEISRHMYVWASPDTPPAQVLRPLARGGDLLRRSSAQGHTWWLVTAVTEDFSAAAGAGPAAAGHDNARWGWVLVVCTLQHKVPDFSACPWWATANNGGSSHANNDGTRDANTVASVHTNKGGTPPTHDSAAVGNPAGGAVGNPAGGAAGSEAEA